MAVPPNFSLTVAPGHPASPNKWEMAYATAFVGVCPRRKLHVGLREGRALHDAFHMALALEATERRLALAQAALSNAGLPPVYAGPATPRYEAYLRTTHKLLADFRRTGLSPCSSACVRHAYPPPPPAPLTGNEDAAAAAAAAVIP